MINATVSLVEAGKYLGIGRSTAYELARQGKLPVLRLGKKLRVPKIALYKMLADCSTSENGGNNE